MTGLIASIVEAYGELRVNKNRIMLALIGVGFSVFALTAVLGAGSLFKATFEQMTEAQSGRAGVIQVAVHRADGTNDTAQVIDEFETLQVTHWTRSSETSTRVQMSTGVRALPVQAVDPAYADMYRVKLLEGRWFTAADEDRLAPALVVNQSMYEEIGSPPLGNGVPVSLHGPEGTTETARAVIIGVVKDVPGIFGPPQGMEAMVLFETASGLPGAEGAPEVQQISAWVPPEDSFAVADHLAAALDPGPDGDVSIQNTMDWAGEADIIDYLSYAIAGIAGLVLILGAMGLVNISLVSMRYRIREIGIRRSYGATGARIFVGVMMESVVATVIAGAIGVTLAVALLRLPIIIEQFEKAGLVEAPPFPMSAVLVGMGAATLVGILAGALPAIVATRIKVIDAIRS
ncbi:ABC transporter permease [Brachybacterium timonense]|uniref:ABC transporter permease n=1 Tax=Brachybacterium timonense TaxID=2050896 RepID=UPI000D0BAE68|nr:ABC transporter permease [Brachybacterium timonense]